MRRLFLSFLVALTFLVPTTFAGMAVFGMSEGMHHEDGASCVGSECHAMPEHGTSGVDCVAHCLSAIPAAATVGPSLFAVVAIVVLAAFALLGSALPADVSAALRQRWREGIHKAILKQEVSTVILRN